MSFKHFLMFLFGIVLLITSSFAKHQKPHTYSLPTQDDNDDGGDGGKPNIPPGLPPPRDDFTPPPSRSGTPPAPPKDPIEYPIDSAFPPIHKP